MPSLSIKAPSTASRPRRAGRSLLRVIGLPAALFLLCTALSITAAPRADAWAVPPVPVVIGETLSSPAAETLSLGVCAGAALVCAGLGAAALGIGLYATHDTWLPIAKGILNMSTEDWLRPFSGGSCAAQASFRADPDNPAGLILHTSAPASSCSMSANAHSTFVCSTATGGTITGTSDPQVRFGGEIDNKVGYCSAGQSILQVNVTTWFNSKLVGLVARWQGAISPSQLDQTTTVNCQRKNADGTVANQTIEDTLFGVDGQVGVPSCIARLGDNWFPTDVSVKAGPHGGTQNEVRHVTVNPGADYGDCWTELGLVCKTKVWVNGQPCTTSEPRCGVWPDYAVDHPEEVKCKFGGHVVAMSNCDPLKHAYEQGAKPRTITETNPDGSTKLDTDSQTGTGTDTDTKVGTGVNTTPGDDPGDGSGGNCMSGAFTLNPVDWVYVPVKCALRWAFVPKTSLQTRVDQIKGTVGTKFPFSVIGGLTGLAPAIGMGDCPDWRIKVQHGGADLDKNVVCDSSYTSAIRTARPVFTVMMMVTALWPLLRGIAYGAFPIIKPTPTR